MPSPYGRQRPRDDRRSVRERRDELAREPRLADARRPEHRDEPARALGDRRVERRSARARARRRAPDERSVERAARRPARPRSTRTQAVRGNRLGLPLQRERLDRLDLDRAARSARVCSPSRISPGGAACSSRAATLTASPVARRSSVPVTTSPVLTPDPQLQRDAVVALELLVEGRERVTELRRGAKRAQRIVLVQRSACRRPPSPRRR